MIAYNCQSLDNLDLQQQARDAFEKGLITGEEYDRIRAAHPHSFYLPDFFIRIGLFVLTLIAAAAGFGLLAFSAIWGGEKALSIVTLIYGLIAIIVLESFVRQRRKYGSGVDDALLWIAAVLLWAGVNLFIAGTIPRAAESSLVLCLALTGMLRYADHGLALVAYGAFLCLVFYLVAQWGPIARALLPFLVMGLSIGCYFLFTRLQEKNALRHYHSCLQLLRMAALLSLYAAGNYYVVREANAMLSGHPAPIALAWLWWLLTAIIPIGYIVRGVQKKDVLFLWTGMALVAASLFTIRYYYHLLPTEIVTVIGGIVLIAGVYGLTRYLRTPKHGFTAAAAGHPHLLTNLPVEGLIIAEGFSKIAAQPADGSLRFGGGDTGGGGAGGQY